MTLILIIIATLAFVILFIYFDGKNFKEREKEYLQNRQRSAKYFEKRNSKINQNLLQASETLLDEIILKNDLTLLYNYFGKHEDFVEMIDDEDEQVDCRHLVLALIKKPKLSDKILTNPKLHKNTEYHIQSYMDDVMKDTPEEILIKYGIKKIS